MTRMEMIINGLKITFPVQDDILGTRNRIETDEKSF